MIAVGVDERPASRDALALGRGLAAALHEDLLLVWVHPPERQPGRAEAIFRLPALLERRLKTEDIETTIRELADASATVLPAGLRSRVRLVAANDAADGLAEAVREEGVSLLVLGSSERAGLGRIVPGSTAVRLLSGDASVPVAVAPRGSASRRAAVGQDGNSLARPRPRHYSSNAA